MLRLLAQAGQGGGAKAAGKKGTYKQESRRSRQSDAGDHTRRAREGSATPREYKQSRDVAGWDQKVEPEKKFVNVSSATKSCR